MTPDDLARRYPRLFHLTAPEALDGIMRFGLRSTTSLLRDCAMTLSERTRIETTRRPAPLLLQHEQVGKIEINDNKPLHEANLATVLDDGLTPADWLSMLNARVFFWAREEGLQTLSSAAANRTRPRLVLVINTLRLAHAYTDGIDLSPINTGSTMRQPARRGLATFTPMQSLSFEAWRRQRGRRDHVKEVAVRCDIPDIGDFIMETRHLG
jgi:hypothetical protein